MKQYTVWEETPLKWHKFVIFFALPLSILINSGRLFSGLNLLQEWIGTGMEWLAAIDVLVYFALAVLSMAAMVGGLPGIRRWFGPVCYLSSLCLNVVYNAALILIYREFSVDPTAVMFIQLIMSAVFLILNGFYYSNRKPIFSGRTTQMEPKE